MKQRFGILVALLCLMCGMAGAQTITGSITGTAIDPSGAAVPGVKIVATNTGTNGAFSAITNERGVYNLVFLPVGSYAVEAQIQGFKKVTMGPFQAGGEPDCPHGYQIGDRQHC